MAAAISDDPAFCRMRRRSLRWPVNAQHQREEFLRDRKIVLFQAILCHQQPAARRCSRRAGRCMRRSASPAHSWPHSTAAVTLAGPAFPSGSGETRWRPSAGRYRQPAPWLPRTHCRHKDKRHSNHALAPDQPDLRLRPISQRRDQGDKSAFDKVNRVNGLVRRDKDLARHGGDMCSLGRIRDNTSGGKAPRS